MALSTAYYILEVSSDPKLFDALGQILSTVSVTQDEELLLKRFHCEIVEQIKSLATAYLLTFEEADEETQIYCHNQFKEQLGYFWIELQSEWIRFNNLANFKLSLKGEYDPISMSKASICSLFLQPLAVALDDDLVDANVVFLKSLLKRARLKDSTD